MLRKILISLTTVAIASAFIACQSEENITGPAEKNITGPVNLNEDDGCGVWGYVRWADGVGEPGVEVTCRFYPSGVYIDHDPSTGAQGWYECINWMRWKYIDEEWISVHAYKSGVIDETKIRWYTIENAPLWVCFDIPGTP